MEATESDGLTMSGIEKWLMEEKSFGITGAGILLSLCLIIFSVWLFLKQRSTTIYLDGKSYEIVGFAKSVDHGQDIFMPVYKEKR
jgi:hypothetical protein